MTRRDPDERAQELFRAARREAPSADVRSRTLDAMLRRASQTSPSPRASRARTGWLLGGGLAAAAILLLVEWNREPVSDLALAPEPVPARGESPGVAASEAPPAAAKPTATESAQETAPRAPSRAPQARPTLAEEIAALDSARGALQRGDAQRALRLLAEYDRRHGNKRMTSEATLLRIEALARSGNRDEASRLAQDFVQKNPASPLVDRARALAGTGTTEDVEEP